MAQPGVSTLVVGASKPEHVQRNAKAVGVKVPSDILAMMTEVSAPVLAKLGDNPDMWADKSRYR